jgi:hypothetical protein
MIPKSCRLFGQDHATEQMPRAKSVFNLKRFRSRAGETLLREKKCSGRNSVAATDGCSMTAVNGGGF